MESLVDTSVSPDGIPWEVAVYNFPSWHPSPAMEKYFGKGWTEFETVRNAKPWFEGEIQSKRPLWGMYNESRTPLTKRVRSGWRARLNWPLVPASTSSWLISNRTADQFELQLLAVKYFVANQHIKPPVVFLAAWNEWTEDHFLMPDATYGYSYLAAVRRQFVR
jgi:hypothetical protein